MDIILSLFRGKSNDLGNDADSAAAALWPAGLPEPGNLFRNIVFALSIHHPDVAPPANPQPGVRRNPPAAWKTARYPAMRYCYHNRAYLSGGARYGLFCEPVKRNDKCVIGRGNQLVRFSDGALAVVVRRALRLREKCRIHKGTT